MSDLLCPRDRSDVASLVSPWLAAKCNRVAWSPVWQVHIIIINLILFVRANGEDMLGVLVLGDDVKNVPHQSLLSHRGMMTMTSQKVSN